MLEKGIDVIVKRWQADKLRPLGRKRASRLIEAARASVGKREGIRAAEAYLMILLEDYEMKTQQLGE